MSLPEPFILPQASVAEAVIVIPSSSDEINRDID